MPTLSEVRKQRRFALLGIVSALALVMAVLVGCVVQTPEDARNDQIKGAQQELPADATQVEPLGGHWFTFEWRGRKFLYRKSFGDKGPTLTELSPDKPEMDGIQLD